MGKRAKMELHTYYSNQNLLRVTWGEKVELDSLHRHFELLKANKTYSRRLRVISSSEVEEIRIPLTRENMILIKGWREDALTDYQTIKTALYGLSPVPAAYVHYFSEFFDSEKSLIRQFTTEKEALAWLEKSENVL